VVGYLDIRALLSDWSLPRFMHDQDTRVFVYGIKKKKKKNNLNCLGQLKMLE
jgi:hypothetical protein